MMYILGYAFTATFVGVTVDTHRLMVFPELHALKDATQNGHEFFVDPPNCNIYTVVNGNELDL